MKTDKTLVDELERTHANLTDAIVERHRQMKQVFGDRPMWGKRRSPAERFQYYEMIKNDPEEWQKIADEDGPGEALKFALDMERFRVKQIPNEEPTG